MTKRVVSLMGVAAVATMVILAGCSSGPGAAPAESHGGAGGDLDRRNDGNGP